VIILDLIKELEEYCETEGFSFTHELKDEKYTFRFKFINAGVNITNVRHDVENNQNLLLWQIKRQLQELKEAYYA